MKLKNFLCITFVLVMCINFAGCENNKTVINSNPNTSSKIVSSEETKPKVTVKLNKSIVNIDLEEKVTLIGTVTPNDVADKTLTWSSLDPYFATVDQSGIVTGVASGETYIKAELSTGECATCKVIVNKSTLKLPTFPTIINNFIERGSYIYEGKMTIFDTTKITNISYEIEPYPGSKISIYVYFSGTKLFDEDGNDNDADCRIRWKLYDSKNTVVASGVHRTVALAVGENYTNSKLEICGIPEGNYRLELFDVE